LNDNPLAATARLRIDEALRSIEVPAEPAALYDPVRYVLDSGGKRVRPVMLMLCAEAYGADEEDALPAALAVEVFHNFTLVHDDIMDHSPARRGRPTVHARWDEPTAVLAGDYLFGLAYDLLVQAPAPDGRALVRRFHHAVERLCEGQALDKAYERATDVTVDSYLDMIDRKTGALIEMSLELGAMVGGAGPRELERLSLAGRALGRAFQIQDDLLDVTADGEGWGKAVGGDLVEGKRTFLLLSALELSRGEDRTWFERALSGLQPEQVDEARDRMSRLGVLDAARETVEDAVRHGLAALEALPAGLAAEALRQLAGELASRRS
jgi:geranylgeranyl diphosphate synthase type II